MTRDARYDVLFEPVVIGPKVMKNRFYQTPHATGLGAFPAAQAHYRAMRAEGGWAVVNTGVCLIHPENDTAPFVQDKIWDDTDVRNLALMCEKVHEEGALAGIELHFGSSNSTTFETRRATRGISQVNHNHFFMKSAYVMGKAEIRELQRIYVAAARRARTAGFDIINVHGRESCSMPVMFLMRYYNKRTDEYGGNIENRARFWLETLESVREAVGDDCAIAAGLTVDSGQETKALGYMEAKEEGIAFVQLADDLVDLWDMQVGGKRAGEWTDDAAASRVREEYWQRPWYETVAPYATKPVVGVGRFTNPDTMLAAVKSGVLDIIGAARPSISDPFLPRKLEEGRVDEIRECIGCNMCVSRYNQVVPIVCTQNATVGEEYRRGWHPETFSLARNRRKDVVIVGAGPAGMECAIVLGKRGMHAVHLVEAARDMGGHMRWVPRLPGLGEWGRVVNYRQIQIAKLRNVEFIPQTRLDATAAREYGAEIVIVATGARWVWDGTNGETQSTIRGADTSRPNQLTPDQLMAEGKPVPGERVLVYDCDGYFVGAGVAEMLARAGHRVTLVTPREKVGAYLAYTGEFRYVWGVLSDLGVAVYENHVVNEICEASVWGYHLLQEGDMVEWPADAVILVTQRTSRSELYQELASDQARLEAEGIEAVYAIGDCVEPRVTADAIFDGHRLGREIDTENPATPLPYIREQRVLGFTDADYDAMRLGRATP